MTSNEPLFEGMTLVSDDGLTLQLKPVVDTPSLDPIPINPTPLALITQAMDVGPEEEAARVLDLTRARKAVKENYVGLNAAMRKFLYARALNESDGAAARAAEVPVPTVSRWKRKYPAFQRAYATLFIDPESFSMHMIGNLLPSATSVLEHALTNSSIKMTDRLRAVRMVMESRGILKPEGERDVNEAELMLARQLIERGVALPPALRDTVLEGEFSEVTEQLDPSDPSLDEADDIVEEELASWKELGIKGTRPDYSYREPYPLE